MRNSFDVIVIGGGAMGSSTSWHLARRGVRVLCVDAHGIPNDQGSSHGGSRAIRLAYYEHPDYVPLLRRAYELWRDLESESGEDLLTITGGLYLGQAGSEIVRGSLESARMHGLEHEMLDRTALADRFPLFDIPDDFEAFYEPSAGMLAPEACVDAMATQAAAHGATVRDQEPVVDWSAGPEGVTVRTTRDTYSADRLVVCAGAWSAKLLRDVGVALQVTRQVVGWLEPDDSAQFAVGAFPLWALVTHEGEAFYGLPIGGPIVGPSPLNRPLGDLSRWRGGGLKVARHGAGTVVDADTVDRSPSAADAETFLPAARRFLPQAGERVTSMNVCLYTNSPDHHFIVDRHPAHENVFVACGFSGHGFKFASVVGEVLADLAETGTTSHPVGFLGLGRFASAKG